MDSPTGWRAGLMPRRHSHDLPAGPVPALEGAMWALLSPRLLIALAIAGVLAATHLTAYRSGRAAVRVLWDADVAQRTAEALKASEKARQVEQELSRKVRNVTTSYHAARANTDHVAAAAAVGMRNLQSLLTKPSAAASDPAPAAGADDDPRNGILAECAGSLVRLDKEARRLADQTIALQSYAIGVCLTP
jgi:hypothetical protein